MLKVQHALCIQMYNLIRGRGLTYGVSMSSSVTEGRMRVKFTRSSQLRDENPLLFQPHSVVQTFPSQPNMVSTALKLTYAL